MTGYCRLGEKSGGRTQKAGSWNLPSLDGIVNSSARPHATRAKPGAEAASAMARTTEPSPRRSTTRVGVVSDVQVSRTKAPSGLTDASVPAGILASRFQAQPPASFRRMHLRVPALERPAEEVDQAGAVGDLEDLVHPPRAAA